MKKKFLLCFSYLTFFNLLTSLFILLGSAYITRIILAILLAVFAFLLAIPLAFTLREKKPLMISSALIGLCAIGTGFAISAYFIHINFKEAIDLAILGKNILIANIGILLFYCLYSLSLNIDILEDHIKLYTYSLLLVLLIVAVLLWVNQDKYLFSLVFYFYLNAALYIFPLIVRAENVEDLYLHLVVASFGAFLLITVVTIIIISEGDGFDLDLISSSGVDVESPRKSKVNEHKEL